MTVLAFSKEAFIEDIEKTVLGSMMFGAVKSEVIAPLQEHHFVDRFHQSIFTAIKKANENFSSTTPITVMRMMPEQVVADFEKTRGKKITSYLAELLGSSVDGGALAAERVKKLISQWARLSMADHFSAFHAAANDPSSDVETIARQAATSIDDIMSECRSGAVRKARSSLADAATAALEAAMNAKGSNGVTGVTWGLVDINEATGGIHKRDLTVIGARPSMGKTSLGFGVARFAAQAGNPVGFISLEMDRDKLAARAISDALYDFGVCIAYQDILKGKVSDTDLDDIAREAVRFNEIPIIIDDQAGQTMADIRTRAERLVEETERSGNRLSTLIIDHLGLIKPSSRYSGQRVHEVSEITAGLKQMARDLDIAVILLSQLSREVERRDNKRPQLSDLRDSGAIEQDADMIAFLFREAYYLEKDNGGTAEDKLAREDRIDECRNNLEFIIAKQRNGPVKTVELFIDIAYSAVRNKARR